MITADHRAGHALRVKAPGLVEEIVAEHYRLRPELSERYGPEGRRFCLRDVGHHIQFLAAAVELGEAARFVAYVTWVERLLAAHGVPPSDLSMTLRIMRDVIAARLTPGAAEAACAHMDAALATFPAGEAGPSRPGVKPAAPRPAGE